MKNNLTKNQELPYEKFLALGAEALTEAELIAIILRTGTKDCPALKMAQKVLSLAKGKEPGLNGLHHISLEELMEIPGIGEVKAVKIKCIAELAVRMACERAAASVRFNYPDTVAAYYMEKLRHEEKEIVLLLLLDNKLNLIGESLPFIHPRGVYRGPQVPGKQFDASAQSPQRGSASEQTGYYNHS